LARRLGLSDTVKFLGPQDDIPHILSKLNILVLSPSEQEAFGRAVIEAQASGVPVVATSVGGIVDIVKDGSTGLLTSPNDPKDLAEKIIRLAKDKKLQERLAETARKSVEENFSLDKMAEATIELYEEALRAKRILIIKMSAIVDVVLSIPSLRAIRNKFKDARIKVLVGIESKDILKRCPYIDEIIVYDQKGKDKGLSGFLKYASLLRRMNFDVLIDLQNNRKSHLLGAASFIPLRAGYDNKKFSVFLNRRIKEPTGPMDPVTHQAHLLKVLGITMDDTSLELWPSESDERWALRFLEDAWVNEGQLLIGINPGASSKWSTKRWPLENFAKLCDMLANKLHARVVITGTKDDLEESSELLELCKSRPIMAVGKSSLLELASLIKRCNVFVTSDSAPMHVACATKRPFVAIFGPTDPKRHLAPCRDCIIIRKELGCSPCYNSKCIKGLKCMREITVEEMFAAVKKLIEVS
jgi:lipopolysaccharide heptosyltransferase II